MGLNLLGGVAAPAAAARVAPLWAGGNGVARREELAQGRIDLALVRDRDGDEPWILHLGKGRHQRAGGPIVPLAKLAVAGDVSELPQAMDEIHTALVVPGQVVAVGEVERIDVP